MDRAFLEGLGLTVTESTESAGVVEAELALAAPPMNPLTQQVIEAVTFTVMGDRLLYVGPPELVGAQPINLAFLSPATRLEDLVTQTLGEHVFQLQRRSAELSAIGVAPHVDPQSLQLSAELQREPFRFVIAANRAGLFRLIRVERAGAELSLGAQTTFDLSEYRDRRALEDFLFALYADVGAPRAPGVEPAPAQRPDGAVSFKELYAAFADASLPARSGLELVAEARVGDEVLRFAAARVVGRTFRGLLAGPSGKLWTDRFELDDFLGVRQLVAEVMKVPVEKVTLLP